MLSYGHDCVTARSMPFWCVSNPLGDPFGGPVLNKITPVETAKLIAWGAKEGYLEMTGFHDDDLVPWNPDQPEDDKDPNSAVSKQLAEIKAILDEADVRIDCISCCLHGPNVFRNGGIGNPDADIRALARAKVERAIRIGHFMGARLFIYWVARDGFEVPITVDWKHIYDYLADACDHAYEYIKANHFDNYEGCSIEPKPNEPRGQMFLPTAGHAAAFILGKLKHPEFWGVNPELLQHESMCLLNSVMTVGFLCSMNKLILLHFGSQIKAQFDNDFPPLIGPEGLKESCQMFWALNQIGWKGIVEYDCHMLRAEGDLDDQIGCRKQFIINCSQALDIALQLAKRIQAPDPNEKNLSKIDLTATQQMCGLSGVSGKR